MRSQTDNYVYLNHAKCDLDAQTDAESRFRAIDITTASCTQACSDATAYGSVDPKPKLPAIQQLTALGNDHDRLNVSHGSDAELLILSTPRNQPSVDD